tara:strand:+ start:3044 stop:3667 length:624 start_codon:yes stop_codon:yes gene_type:complete
MATTRKKLAEQIVRILDGGNISDDSRISKREVMALIDQERDTLIRQLIEDRFYTKSTTTNKAELEITGDFVTLDTSLSVSSNKVELPSQPITLPNDMGIVRVYTSSHDYIRMPYGGGSFDGSPSPIYNNTVGHSGKKFFYIQGNELYLYQDASATVNVAYVAVSSTLSDTATYPIPADMESIIVKNLVETLNLLKAAEEDYRNNNLG